ncbi:MFS transporter [Microbacterium sp. X-17]|uniref:MFS transporter n=1 Tax=Microbacterium sp. X-17 TaxID=3144404 RepID=UPI0031F58FD8
MGTASSRRHRMQNRAGGTQSHSTVKVFLGIVLGLLVGVLSTSMINTSLPVIVADLGGGQSTLTWVATGPLLALTVSTPIWGKVSDVVGRKPLMLIALLLFIASSFGAGLSATPIMLIAARSVQGLATGGLLTLPQVVLSDVISPRDRGRYSGLMGAIITAGTAGGPIVGGSITDAFGWRWTFFALVPFAIVALAVIALRLRLPHRHSIGRIDYVGSALLVVSISALLLWLSLAGTAFAWDSALSWAIAAGAVALLTVTAIVQARKADSVLPVRLFRDRTFALAVISSFCVGVVIYGYSIYLIQYLQFSRGATASQAGLMTLPQVTANLIASSAAGFLISRFGAWKPWLVAGGVFISSSAVLLATLRAGSPIVIVYIGAALIGLGLGMTLQTLVLAVQNASDPREVGTASSAVSFFRSLGGVLAISCFGSLLEHRVSAEIASGLARAGITHSTLGTTPGALPDVTSLPQSARIVVETAYGDGIGLIFAIMIPVALVALVCIILIPNARLKTQTGIEQLAEFDAVDS